MGSGLVTPEAVLLELPTAGVATRAFARLVDLVLQILLAIALALLIEFTLGASFSPTLVAVGLSFVVLLVAPIGTELLWRGRSPGKAMFGLRVVGADGSPEAPRQAIVRGLVALVDLYLSLGFIATATAMFSSSTQRSGDMAAGTVVIRGGARLARTPVAFLPPAGYESYTASLDVGLLRDDDFALLREFLLRTNELGVMARASLALQLATTIQERIHHTLPGPVDPEVWLICVASAYQQRHGGLLADAAAGLAPRVPVATTLPAPTTR